MQAKSLPTVWYIQSTFESACTDSDGSLFFVFVFCIFVFLGGFHEITRYSLYPWAGGSHSQEEAGISFPNTNWGGVHMYIATTTLYIK